MNRTFSISSADINMAFDLLDVAKLQAQPPGDELAILLRAAASYVDGNHLDQAAWRVADACMLLRERLAASHQVLGLDIPTGRWRCDRWQKAPLTLGRAIAHGPYGGCGAASI